MPIPFVVYSGLVGTPLLFAAPAGGDEGGVEKICGLYEAKIVN